MVKVDFFNIDLVKQSPVYKSGELFAGILNFKVTERFKINSVKLRLTGEAKVEWTEKDKSGKTSRTIVYSATEKYFDNEIFFSKKESDSDLYLEVGDYSYPFEYVLPPNLPTSFEHEYGKIRYFVKAIIDIPWAFDKETVKSFTIIKDYDLNFSQHLKDSFKVSGEKFICCGPCKSQPITANFSAYKTGYVCGEGIAFDASIENRSKRSIKEMSVRLVQKVFLNASNKTKVTRKTLSTVEYPHEVPMQKNETWSNSILTIPPTCSSSDNTCKIITVLYELIYNFDASGISNSTDLTIPIVIGTIPFAGTLSHRLSYKLQERPIRNSTSNQNINQTSASTKSNFQPLYPYLKNVEHNPN